MSGVQKPNTSGIGMTSQRTRDRMIARLREQGIRSESVLSALAEIPRHLFMDEALSSRAYEDTALPIGQGQTISQPYIVARMTELIMEKRDPGKILEVGTGCGYQTAVLAHLGKHVQTCERIQALSRQAQKNLQSLGVWNVEYRVSDGHHGWNLSRPEFDSIVVTAAAREIPKRLVQQLKTGGRMVIPVGESEQWLYLIEKTATQFQQTRLEAVSFVPLKEGIQ